MMGRIGVLRFDEYAFGVVLTSEEMLAAVAAKANEIKDRAEAAAPVGSDAHAGRYKESFRVEESTHGGVKHDRAEAVVVNDAPEAVFVEYGTSRQDPHHTLLRAAVEG